MSRPRNTRPNLAQHINNNNNNSDVIDFVNNTTNHLASQVVGGPPAYLVSHNIRYVPEGAFPTVGPTKMEAKPMAYASIPAREEDLDTRIQKFIKPMTATPAIPPVSHPTNVIKRQMETERALARMEKQLEQSASGGDMDMEAIHKTLKKLEKKIDGKTSKSSSKAENDYW